MQKNNVKLYKNDWKILTKIPKYGKNKGTKNKENINEQTDVATDEETLEAQEGDELKTEPNETQTVSQAMPLIDSLEGTSIDVTEINIFKGFSKKKSQVQHQKYQKNQKLLKSQELKKVHRLEIRPT